MAHATVESRLAGGLGAFHFPASATADIIVLRRFRWAAAVILRWLVRLFPGSFLLVFCMANAAAEKQMVGMELFELCCFTVATIADQSTPLFWRCSFLFVVARKNRSDSVFAYIFVGCMAHATVECRNGIGIASFLLSVAHPTGDFSSRRDTIGFAVCCGGTAAMASVKLTFTFSSVAWCIQLSRN